MAVVNGHHPDGAPIQADFAVFCTAPWLARTATRVREGSYGQRGASREERPSMRSPARPSVSQCVAVPTCCPDHRWQCRWSPGVDDACGMSFSVRLSDIHNKPRSRYRSTSVPRRRNWQGYREALESLLFLAGRPGRHRAGRSRSTAQRPVVAVRLQRSRPRSMRPGWSWAWTEHGRTWMQHGWTWMAMAAWTLHGFHRAGAKYTVNCTPWSASASSPSFKIREPGAID